jgi:hypothetical protein
LKTLGYQPRVSFDQGLPSLVDWYVANANLRPGAAPALASGLPIS